MTRAAPRLHARHRPCVAWFAALLAAVACKPPAPAQKESAPAASPPAALGVHLPGGAEPPPCATLFTTDDVARVCGTKPADGVPSRSEGRLQLMTCARTFAAGDHQLSFSLAALDTDSDARSMVGSLASVTVTKALPGDLSQVKLQRLRGRYVATVAVTGPAAEKPFCDEAAQARLAEQVLDRIR